MSISMTSKIIGNQRNILISGMTFAFALALTSTSAIARNQLRIVGSSTVFPFSTAVAEYFGRTTKFRTPIVETTGTGGGMKLFCSGIGYNTPDITNASRRIKEKEYENCGRNGVTPIEVKIGFDGIVLANSISGQRLSVNLRQIYLALAKNVPGPDGKLVKNPYIAWSDIDASLPPVKIEVLGPPPTSGTRDAFEELAMGGGAITFDKLKKLKGLAKDDEQLAQISADLGLSARQIQPAAIALKGKTIFKQIAYEIREDGAYIEAGENDNLIIQKLEKNPHAFGIFGFSFLDQNSDKVQGARVGGFAPEFENIAAGNYKISRSLYFYIKKEHVGVVAGIREFLHEFTKKSTWGDEGYLSEKGLIPLNQNERNVIIAKSTAVMSPGM